MATRRGSSWLHGSRNPFSWASVPAAAGSHSTMPAWATFGNMQATIANAHGSAAKVDEIRAFSPFKSNFLDKDYLMIKMISIRITSKPANEYHELDMRVDPEKRREFQEQMSREHNEGIAELNTALSEGYTIADSFSYEERYGLLRAYVLHKPDEAGQS